MFQLGETVLYGTEGVCTIADISEMKFGSKTGKYYVLRPVYRRTSTIYVPAENEMLTGKMRRVLSAEEIDALLHDVTDCEVDWIEDPGERKTEYAKILTGGDRCELVRLIRALYLRRSDLQEKGKRLRTGDDQLLRDAEKLLNDEFAMVLQIPQDEVPEYIRARIEKNT